MSRTERDAARPGVSRWLGPATFAVLLTVASVVPVPSSGAGGVLDGAGAGSGGTGVIPVDVGLTEPFHVIGYAVLAALVTRATGRTRRGLLIAVVAATAFGFGIELVQAPIPWRTFAWWDVTLNAVGAVTGAVAVALGGRFDRAGDDDG